MKRTALCSVLFFAMFIILAGILCMGVAAEEDITLVNPFDSSDTFKVPQSDDVIAYRFILEDKKFNQESEPEKLEVSELEGWAASSDYTVIYVMNNFTVPENQTLNLYNYSNVWIIGATNDIVISKDNITAPFVNKYGSGSATIKSLTFDGKGSVSSTPGITVTSGSLTLIDVTVTNCTGGGVRVTGDGKINVSGSTMITGNTANGKESNLYSESPINVTGNLTGKIGIDMTWEEGKVVATGDALGMYPDSVDAFSLDNNSGYKPTLNDKKELVFTASGSTDPDPNPGQDNQKESIPGITLDGDRDADNKKITFTITSNIPECIGDYVPFTGTVDNPSTQRIPTEEERGKYMLVFHNTLDNKLELDENSIRLTIKSEDISSYLKGFQYTTEDHKTFEIGINLIDLYNKYFTLDDIKNPLPEIVLSFDALPVNGNLNDSYTDTAYIEYGSSESNLTATKTASITIDPLYTVTVFKYDQENENEGLAGADFELVGNNKTYTGTTGDDGKIIFAGLSEGTYILSEAKAPDGYAKSKETYTVACNSTKGYAVTVKFANVKLPHTGGLGYKLPITIGIIGVIVGGAFIAVGRKKKSEK